MKAVDHIGNIILTVVVFALAGAMAYAWHDSNVQDEKRLVETSKKWNDWLTYRNSNCRIVEKMYGLSETSGKFHQNDNATVYDCHGMKYVVAESVEYAAKTGLLSDSQIPVPEKE